MNVSETRHVKKSRKSYHCDWCYDLIEKGSAYKTWFCFGENVTVRMHTECYDAMNNADLYDQELPTAGTYRRGCWCGEKQEFCKCADTKDGTKGGGE